MRTKRVVVVPYDEAWETAFKTIKHEIEAVIGDMILGIEHIGSTSVKGMPAKPCIDIDMSMKLGLIMQDKPKTVLTDN